MLQDIHVRYLLVQKRMAAVERMYYGHAQPAFDYGREWRVIHAIDQALANCA